MRITLLNTISSSIEQNYEPVQEKPIKNFGGEIKVFDHSSKWIE